ncbi:S1 family peptidase [Sorangium sp. So ce1078]|uniref:S1 family peptidase n=1 Tax=Sorangium sp. So ce1078 TaxID=3133329 RepID=UPI003F62D026
MRKGIIFVAAAILSACTGEVDDLPLTDTDVASAAIIGGTIDEGDPAVAMLWISAAGQDTGDRCTASLIAPQVLLTAAHCVLPDKINGKTVTAFFGTYSDGEEGTWVNVVETHYDPEYDHTNKPAGHDVAVAILEEPVTIQPLPYNRAPMTEDMVGDPVRLIGFGDDHEIWGFGGVKHHVSTIVNTVTPTLLGLGDRDHHTCRGDSGGPALMDVNGVPTIVGVTSFGASQAPSTCTEGWDSRVDISLDFIDQFVNAP